MWSPEPTLKNGMFITNVIQPKNHEKIIFFISSIRIIYS